MKKSQVAIVRCLPKSCAGAVAESVRQAVGLVGGLDGIKAGDIVLIKPNICAVAARDSGVFANPFISRALADMVAEKGGRAVIGEASGVADITEEAIQADGYGELRKAGYEVIDLKAPQLAYRKVPVVKGQVLKEVVVPQIVIDAKLVISVPVMKTHPSEKVSLAIKNMKGILPDLYKKRFHTHLGVTQSVIDLMTVFKPGLAVVDGIVAQEGMGPMLGTPVDLGILIAGKDVVAVDAVAAAAMGFSSEELPIIAGAGQAGLGITDLNNIEILGIPLQDVKRRFVRFEEAVQQSLPFPEDFKLIINEKTCTGCRGTVLGAMFALNQEKKLDMLKGWTVVVGQAKTVPEADKSRLLVVGNCLKKCRDKGVFVEACPPWPWQVINALKGENTDPWNLNRL